MTWADIAGANTASDVPSATDVHSELAHAGTLLRVSVDYTDAQGFYEQAFSGTTSRIGVHLAGDVGADALTTATPYDDWARMHCLCFPVS